MREREGEGIDSRQRREGWREERRREKQKEGGREEERGREKKG